MKQPIMSVVLAVIVVAPCFAQTNRVAGVPFDHWAYDAVQYLVDKGIIIGYPEGTFKGHRALTRWEFAMAVSRGLGTIKPQKHLQGNQGGTGSARAQARRQSNGKPVVAEEVKIAAVLAKLASEFEYEVTTVRKGVGGLRNAQDLTDLNSPTGTKEIQARKKALKLLNLP
jgi:hypothetical protein